MSSQNQAITIGPGVVDIDLRGVDASTLSAEDIRDAWAEAEAQALEASHAIEQLLGDLDIGLR